MTQVTQQKLSTWDIEDDDFKGDENLIFDSETGLYKKIISIEDDDGKAHQELLEYKLVINEVSETVKLRKLLKKFGKAKSDPPGPNPAQTYIGEEVNMKFVTDENTAPEEEKKGKDQTVKCRKCGGEHFTHKCPYKEELENIQELSAQIEKLKQEPASEEKSKFEPVKSVGNVSGGPGGSKYMPPHMRNEDKKRTDTANTIRVSNLPEAARETDLEDLFRPFGTLARTFLARDKLTGISRGFAYITFHHRQDAHKAIEGVNGFGYDHCILQVEWAKPQ